MLTFYLRIGNCTPLKNRKIGLASPHTFTTSAVIPSLAGAPLHVAEISVASAQHRNFNIHLYLNSACIKNKWKILELSLQIVIFCFIIWQN